MDHLLQQLENQVFTIETDNNLPKDLNIRGFKSEIKDNKKFSVIIPKDTAINDLFEDATFKTLKITNIKNQTNRLEELFLNLTTKK